MQRLLELSKFRNLGFEKPDTLVINNSISKGELGGIVTLIGQNNSGKSNVLSALLKMRPDNKVKSIDITNLSYAPEDREPSVSIIYRDGSDYFKIKKTLKGQVIETNKQVGFPTPSLEVIKNEMSALFTNLSSAIDALEPKVRQLFADILSDKISEKDALDSIDFIYKYLESNGKQEMYHIYSPYDVRIKNAFETSKKYQTYMYYLFKNGRMEINNEATVLNMLKKYGISNMPNFINYEEQPLSENDLFINDYRAIGGNKFFSSLFEIIGINIEEIKAAYQEFESHPNPSILKRMTTKIEKKMVAINKQFNSLYFAESDAYKFGITLESSKIMFSMARGKEEDAIMLNSQSTGFKWFFNLYFNFLAKGLLKYGDIVVIDEIGATLHPQGLVELRKFLSEYSKKYGITFVVATHNPFFIDRDNLDELRVVSSVNNRAYIDNCFTAINDDDPDSLLPIKEALTIKQNVMYDFDTEVVWVEGITDYCYLTMFKKLLGITDLCFLPFNGVGNSKEQTAKILSKLIKVKMYKRSILVDGDKAGMDMFNQCKGTAFDGSRHNISELSNDKHKYMMIEDLFSEEDRKKYDVVNPSKVDNFKRFRCASLLKNTAKLSDFTEETIKNFKDLFELIQD